MAFYTMSLAGYYVVYGGEALHTFEPNHLFCDSNPVARVHCPNCCTPLLNYLSLDLSAPRLLLHLSDLKRLPLLYCWQCQLQYGDFQYKVTEKNEILILCYQTGSPDPDDILSTSYPTKPARLVSIPSDEQALIQLQNRGLISMDDIWEYLPEYFLRVDRPRHQVFGEPYLSQQNPDIKMTCYSCGKQIPFLCCIADDFGEYRFAEDSWAQILFFYCNTCRVLPLILKQTKKTCPSVFAQAKKRLEFTYDLGGNLTAWGEEAGWHYGFNRLSWIEDREWYYAYTANGTRSQKCRSDSPAKTERSPAVDPEAQIVGSTTFRLRSSTGFLGAVRMVESIEGGS